MTKFLFSTEDSKVHQNFIESQFDEPGIYARELVANALDSNTSRVEVQIGENIFEVEDYGEGMDVGEINEYFLQLHSSKTKQRSNAIGEHGVGVHSLFRTDPYMVEVETCRGNENIRFHIPRDLSLRVREPGVKRSGTRVTVYQTKGAFTHDELKIQSDSPEEKVIRKYCKYHPTPIIVNGKQINREVNLNSNQTLTLNSEKLQGEIGIDNGEGRANFSWRSLLSFFRDESRAKKEHIEIYNHWIFLDEMEDRLFSGIVNSNEISPVISRNAVKQDEQFRRFNKELAAEKVELINKVYNGGRIPRNSEAHQYLLELIEDAELSVREISDPSKDELKTKLANLPLFGRNPAYSLVELYREFQQTGEIIYTRFSVYRDKQFDRRVVESITNRELRILRTIFTPSAVSQIGHSRITPEKIGTDDTRTDSSNLLGNLLRYLNKQSASLAGMDGSWMYFSTIGEKITLPNFGREFDFGSVLGGSNYLQQIRNSSRRVRDELQETGTRLFRPVTEARDSLPRTVGGGLGQISHYAQETSGRLLELGHPIDENDYSESEKNLVFSLKELTEEVSTEEEIDIKQIKLGVFWKESKVAVPGRRFGKEGVLFLNERNPAVKKALGRQELSALYPLIPVILSEGTPPRATIHAQNRKAEMIENTLDEMISQLTRQ